MSEPLYLPADDNAWLRPLSGIPLAGVDLTIDLNWPAQSVRETAEHYMNRQRSYHPFSQNPDDIVPNWPQITMFGVVG
jgi:hypothetical protein